MRIMAATVALVVWSDALIAGGNPWLPPPHGGSVQLSYVRQSADELLAGSSGKTKGSLPAELKQTTTWIDVAYGLADTLSLDGRVGRSENEFAPRPTESGRTDASLGLTWRVRDEFIVDGGPTIALRGGVVIAGNYEAGQINSIGDGASGAEVSVIVGKILTPAISIAADAGYRYRNSSVDDDLFASLTGAYDFSPNVSANLSYSFVRADGDLDIGDPEFTGDFTRVAENVEMYQIGVTARFARVYFAGLTYGDVISGRNTALSEVTSLFGGMSF